MAQFRVDLKGDANFTNKKIPWLRGDFYEGRVFQSAQGSSKVGLSTRKRDS